jgi:dTDP-4-dehydrorhamnose reductase
MKKLLVTGASGFLGWNICNLAKKEWCIYGTVFSHSAAIDLVNIARIDLTDFKEIKKMFREIRPDAVIHTAAAADPNYCQTHKEETHKINVDASIHLAGLCADLDIPYVFISTDLVFDGLKAPYHEEDPVAPVNIYAEQKVLAEEGILKQYPKAAICRTALMYGTGSPVSGSFLQPMLMAMRDGKDVRLFVDEFRNPISAQSAVQGLFIALQKVKGIIHLGGRERISRYDFGRLTMEIFGIPEAKLIPCLQKDLAMAAPRSPDVTLDSSKAYALGFSPLTLREEITRLALSNKAD